MSKNPNYDLVCDAVSKSNKSEIFEPTALSSRQHTFENMPVLCPPCFKLNIFCLNTKGGFFSESSIHFLDLQISKKNYSKELS